MNFFVRVREGGTSCPMILSSLALSCTSVKAIAGKSADKLLSSLRSVWSSYRIQLQFDDAT